MIKRKLQIPELCNVDTYVRYGVGDVEDTYLMASLKTLMIATRIDEKIKSLGNHFVKGTLKDASLSS